MFQLLDVTQDSSAGWAGPAAAEGRQKPPSSLARRRLSLNGSRAGFDPPAKSSDAGIHRYPIDFRGGGYCPLGPRAGRAGCLLKEGKARPRKNPGELCRQILRRQKGVEGGSRAENVNKYVLGLTVPSRLLCDLDEQERDGGGKPGVMPATEDRH